MDTVQKHIYSNYSLFTPRELDPSTDWIGGYEVTSWLRHYTTRRKVAGSRPDDINDSSFFFPIYVILLAALGPGVYSVSNRTVQLDPTVS
jgi:hypothetical protein